MLPNEPRQRLTDDADLARKTRQDDYVINRITKYAILALSLIVAVALTVVILRAVFTDQHWREYAIKAVFEALPGIVAVVVVVLGLKKNN